MANCAPAARDTLRGLLFVAEDQRFTNPVERREWRLWANFAAGVGQHPYLPDLQGAAGYLERKHLFLAFAVALREGLLNSGKSASAATVKATLRYCGQILASRGFADPRKAHDAAVRLDGEFTRLFQQWEDQDPPTVRQLAVPSSVVMDLAQAAGESPDVRTQMVGALATLAFFFLLRVGEYTDDNRRSKQTIPLRKKDVHVWRRSAQISGDCDWEALYGATVVTISLENQKNGQKGCILHHFATGGPFCPVKAMARIMWAIRGSHPDTQLGTFFVAGRIQRVTADDMRKALRAQAISSHLTSQGYDVSRIGNHSLRSGGAVALKLAGFDGDVIKKLGRWSSNTYLIYIQNQIAQLTAGVSRQMGRRLKFYSVG